MTAVETRGRIVPFDLLRGAIMVLMALDHASFFIARVHSREFWGTALPVYPSALPFIIRGITHICAPGFFLLMGVGMAMLTASRTAVGWSRIRISRFFMMRGLILIGIQVLVENPAWGLAFVRGVPGTFISRGGPIPGSGEGMPIYLGVLFALGAVMLFWSLAGRLGTPLVTAISIAALLMTQWLTPGPEAFAFDYPLWMRIFQIPGRSGHFVIFYPVIPWMGITGLGILLGRWQATIREPFPTKAFIAAVILLTGFAMVRSIGGFGNFHPPQLGWIDWLNVTKYPPSLSFILLTLGANALLLGIFSRWCGALSNWLAVFGRTPLFFYILHLYLYGLMGLLVPSGVPMMWMLIFWMAGLAALYPLCRRYARFKNQKSVNALWRLL